MVYSSPTTSSTAKKQHMSKRVDMRKGGNNNANKKVVIPNFIEEEIKEEKLHQQQHTDNKDDAAVAAAPPQQKEQQEQQDTTNAASPSAAAAAAAAPEERASRKERRKEFLQKRLERKLTALERIHEQNDKIEQQQKETGGSGDDNNDGDDNRVATSAQGNDHNDNDNNDDAVNSKPPRKHDIKRAAAASAAPRKAALGGTYWKERKEKKARTIFVGGIPGTAGLGLVRQLLNKFGTDSAIEDPKKDIEVEFIKPKNHEAANFRNGQKKHTIPKNAYCVMPTKELAQRAANVLDGVWVHPDHVLPITDKDANTWRPGQSEHGGKPSKLRVNAADDKQQRDVAISKRKGGDGDKGSYYKKSKRAKDSGYRGSHPNAGKKRE